MTLCYDLFGTLWTQNYIFIQCGRADCLLTTRLLRFSVISIGDRVNRYWGVVTQALSVPSPPPPQF